MNMIRRILRFGWCLNKRLLKRFSFLLILIMIPLIALSLLIISKEESGIVKIALAEENENDELSGEIIEGLMEDNKLLRFIYCETPEIAQNAVLGGEVDGAWIFPDNAEKRIEEIKSKKYIVKVIEREETVPLRLSREKLSGAVFKHFSKQLYLNFALNVEELSSLSKDELSRYYDTTVTSKDGELFKFAYIDGKEAEEVDYITAPIRGIFAVLIILCGLSVACVYTVDDKNGVFSFISLKLKPIAAYFYQVVSMLLVAAVALVSLYAAGFAVSVSREILMMLLFVFCSAGFCINIRLICKKLNVLCAILPVLVLAMLALSPIFLDLKASSLAVKLLPTYYYLNAAHSDKFLIMMAIYAAVSVGIYGILSKLLKRC